MKWTNASDASALADGLSGDGVPQKLKVDTTLCLYVGGEMSVNALCASMVLLLEL